MKEAANVPPFGLPKTVFLDRDGVINEKMPEGRYVASVDEFRLLPGVADAIRELNQAAIRVVVVSNQRGISLGLYTPGDLDAIHLELQRLLQKKGAHIDAFYSCPHDKGECDCRKPQVGLFEQARARFPEIVAEESLIIGDSLSDIEFGRRVGMQTVLIEGDPQTRKAGTETAAEMADLCFASLFEAVEAMRAMKR